MRAKYPIENSVQYRGNILIGPFHHIDAQKHKKKFNNRISGPKLISRFDRNDVITLLYSGRMQSESKNDSSLVCRHWMNDRLQQRHRTRIVLWMGNHVVGTPPILIAVPIQSLGIPTVQSYDLHAVQREISMHGMSDWINAG